MDDLLLKDYDKKILADTLISFIPYFTEFIFRATRGRVYVCFFDSDFNIQEIHIEDNETQYLLEITTYNISLYQISHMKSRPIWKAHKLFSVIDSTLSESFIEKYDEYWKPLTKQSLEKSKENYLLEQESKYAYFKRLCMKEGK